ncbi:MAG TPA: glycerol-3-phosphate dehydrogenase/oxidase [Promineifilum sp.]|nr:glycerol-3-phosphate dehydrogenase/oxidase [Promineifilum sp.]
MTHWNRAWRARAWQQLSADWDIVVVGGGITGAGILHEAARLGLRALLVEQRDFAWGTSSRSSKLVHGGLRYLRTGQVGLTRASVQGREQLLAEGAGLVHPLGFLLAQYEGDGAGQLVYGAGLAVYDLMALQWSHRYYSPADFQLLAPYISPTGLRGGFQYNDAQTDDARLVLRLIREAVDAADDAERQVLALNYVRAEELLRDDAGEVAGVRLVDTSGDEAGRLPVDVRARAVINATGAWADFLRGQVGGEARLRPLRGSHLVFPAWRFPVAQAISFMHPVDGRPVFAFPWEGVTLLGTTDVDCPPPLDADPSITGEEVAYLMAAVTAQFPALGLTLDDISATFAGIRPVIGSGKVDPSEESRDHVVWQEAGLLTVTGGKLTTFRQVGRQALEQVCARVDDGAAWLARLHDDAPLLWMATGATVSGDEAAPDSLPGGERLADEVRCRLLGRYGRAATGLVAAAGPGDLEAIPGTTALWAELRWAARAEGVAHLDDLLLRRVRLGLLLPRGGGDLMPHIRAIAQPELGWDDARWMDEERRYRQLVAAAYALPDRRDISDWNVLLATSQADRERAAVARQARGRARQRRGAAALLVAALLLLIVGLLRRDRQQAGHA